MDLPREQEAEQYEVIRNDTSNDSVRSSDTKELITMESSSIHFQGKTHRMIMAKSLAQTMKTEQL